MSRPELIDPPSTELRPEIEASWRSCTAIGRRPGVSVSQATSAVMLYRLLTYWLVMLPGWNSRKVMQRRGEI